MFDMVSRINDGTSNTPNILILLVSKVQSTERMFPRDKNTLALVTKAVEKGVCSQADELHLPVLYTSSGMSSLNAKNTPSNLPDTA